MILFVLRTRGRVRRVVLKSTVLSKTGRSNVGGENYHQRGPPNTPMRNIILDQLDTIMCMLLFPELLTRGQWEDHADPP